MILTRADRREGRERLVDGLHKRLRQLARGARVDASVGGTRALIITADTKEDGLRPVARGLPCFACDGTHAIVLAVVSGIVGRRLRALEELNVSGRQSSERSAGRSSTGYAMPSATRPAERKTCTTKTMSARNPIVSVAIGPQDRTQHNFAFYSSASSTTGDCLPWCDNGPCKVGIQRGVGQGGA